METNNRSDDGISLHPWRDVTQEEQFREEYGQAEDNSDSGADDTDGQEWRRKRSQQQYRKEYSSAHPGTDIRNKDVAHVLSLELAQHIKSQFGLRLDDGEMKRCLNVSDNFWMVNRETNRVQHTAIDHALMSATPGTRLTQAQERRARQQLGILNNCEFPHEFQAAGRRYFSGLGIRH